MYYIKFYNDEHDVTVNIKINRKRDIKLDSYIIPDGQKHLILDIVESCGYNIEHNVTGDIHNVTCTECNYNIYSVEELINTILFGILLELGFRTYTYVNGVDEPEDIKGWYNSNGVRKMSHDGLSILFD